MNKTSLIERTLANRGGMGNRQPAPGAQQNRQGAAEEMQEGSPEFENLVAELQQLYAKGQLPQDFDMEQACTDPAFSDLMAEMPVSAAVRVYMAERKAAGAEENAREQVSARMRSRGGLPRSQRGGAMASPAPDYAGMSSEAFRSMLAQMKQTARNGGYTRL